MVMARNDDDCSDDHGGDAVGDYDDGFGDLGRMVVMVVCAKSPVSIAPPASAGMVQLCRGVSLSLLFV